MLMWAVGRAPAPHSAYHDCQCSKISATGEPPMTGDIFPGLPSTCLACPFPPVSSFMGCISSLQHTSELAKMLKWV